MVKAEMTSLFFTVSIFKQIIIYIFVQNEHTNLIQNMINYI